MEEINDSYVKNTYDLSFKIVLLGDTGVGKSSIMYIIYSFSSLFVIILVSDM